MYVALALLALPFRDALAHAFADAIPQVRNSNPWPNLEIHLRFSDPVAKPSESIIGSSAVAPALASLQALSLLKSWPPPPPQLYTFQDQRFSLV